MSLRSQKLQELIKEELNNIFLKEFEFGLDKLVTIIKTDASDDLKNCKVWISVLPFNKSKSVMNILSNSKKRIYHLLLKKIRVRSLPSLRFITDDTEEKASRIEEELNKLKKNGKSI